MTPWETVILPRSGATRLDSTLQDWAEESLVHQCLSMLLVQEVVHLQLVLVMEWQGQPLNHLHLWTSLDISTGPMLTLWC